MRKILFLILVTLLVIPLSSQTIAKEDQTLVSTFSIVGRDPATGEMGVAVASRFLPLALLFLGQKQMLVLLPHNLLPILHSAGEPWIY